MYEWCDFQVHADFVLAIQIGPAGVRAIEFGSRPESKHSSNPLMQETVRQLRDYFAGKLREFHLPLDMEGTEFQKRVWHALLTIPYGETRSYTQIAAQIGAPKAVRAVGAANGRNPIPVIVPCHRVIGASGDLVGFGGGLAWKRLLLDLEAKNAERFRKTAAG
jgi:methylated-DNA-[protein]-cysteine S-methyltransferase